MYTACESCEWRKNGENWYGVSQNWARVWVSGSSKKRKKLSLSLSFAYQLVTNDIFFCVCFCCRKYIAVLSKSTAHKTSNKETLEEGKINPNRKNYHFLWFDWFCLWNCVVRLTLSSSILPKSGSFFFFLLSIASLRCYVKTLCWNKKLLFSSNELIKALIVKCLLLRMPGDWIVARVTKNFINFLLIKDRTNFYVCKAIKSDWARSD